MFWISMDKDPKRKSALFEAALLIVALSSLVCVLGVSVYIVAFA